MSKIIHSSGVELSWQKYENARRGWYALSPAIDGWFPGEANVDGRWAGYSADRRCRGEGEASDLASAKASAEECLLDNGIVTLAVKSLPATGAYTFHFRADRGGATVVATVVRGPDTTVLYGVSFCSPRDSFDKNLGRRLAAFRLVDKPLTLTLPGLIGPREIKAAILAALVIPPGNRLVK